MKNITMLTLLVVLINYAVFVENAALLIIAMIILISFYLILLLANYENKPHTYVSFLMTVVFIFIMCKSMQANCECSIQQSQSSYLNN